MIGADFEDFYEALQLSPNADKETVERVYRLLAKRFHPDNPDSGNTERFTQLQRAYDILADPEKRAAYDVKYTEGRTLHWKIFDQTSAVDSFHGDKQIFRGILSLLYVTRRQDVDRPGLGIVHLEKMLNCPDEHLEFHIWYLKEKGWIERLDNGQLAITAAGVEQVAEGDMVLRRDRLLPGGKDGEGSNGKGSNGEGSNGKGSSGEGTVEFRVRDSASGKLSEFNGSSDR